MDLPGLVTTTHHLSGDFETLTTNLIDNLEHRWNWGIGYLEAYLNAEDQRVYQVGGVSVRRDPVDISGITNFSIKLIEVAPGHTETDISTRTVSVKGFPFSDPVKRQFELPTDQHQHDKLAQELVSFCENPHHVSRTFLGVIRRIMDAMQGNMEKRKVKR
jgi:V8-like Glu-specific endopeptidase